VGISIGSFVVLAIIIGVCIRAKNGTVTTNRQNFSSGCHQNVRAQIHPMVHIDRNAPRTNGNQGPYTISMSRAYVEEEPPPSYEAFVSSGGVRK
jgi:hypothetical protein